MHSGTLPQRAVRILTASAVMVPGNGRNSHSRNDFRKFKYGFYKKFLSLGRRSRHIVYITGNNHSVRLFGLSYGNQLTAGIAMFVYTVATV